MHSAGKMIIDQREKYRKKEKKKERKKKKERRKIERNKERQKENRRKAVQDRNENIGSFTSLCMMKQLPYHCVPLTVNVPHYTLADALTTCRSLCYKIRIIRV